MATETALFPELRVAATERLYLRTHKWLKFVVDLRDAPHTFWMQIGEASSKIEHIAGVPLQPETAKRLHLMYIAKGALATAAIEGNTLTEKQVLDHLDGKLKLPPSQQYLTQEIDNILAGCNSIVREVIAEGNSQLTPVKILEYNDAVLRGLQLGEDVVPGRIRTHEVHVANYNGAPAQDCEYLLERLCSWLNNEIIPPNDEMALPYAIIRAILAHLYLAWIHPCGDGNGRTARMVEVQVLVDAGVPTPAAHLLSNHYNQTRSEYYRQLDRASRTGGDVIPFLCYAIDGLVDGLRAQLSHIRQQQWDVAWVNYVHESFRGSKGASDRRRALVLDLSDARRAVPRGEVATLTPRLALAYAKKTEKTLTRDLNALVRSYLVLLTEKGYVANREKILAFLPAHKAIVDEREIVTQQKEQVDDAKRTDQ